MAQIQYANGLTVVSNSRPPKKITDPSKINFIINGNPQPEIPKKIETRINALVKNADRINRKKRGCRSKLSLELDDHRMR